jgi:hypothetical protein
MFHPDLEREAAARITRFDKLFRAQERIHDLIGRALDQTPIRLRDGEREEDLSLVVGASLGKAMKTFAAVRDLCFLGWGEDALVLLRSNVNLLINVGYILGDPDPAERAADLIAYSYLERVKYLKTAHGAEKSSLTPPENDPATLARRAKRWDSIRIKQRAERVPDFHYTKGYALYSSFEHSDAMALNAYISAWDEVGPSVNAAPSDEHIPMALGHNAMVLADVFSLFAAHFGIAQAEVFEEIQKTLDSMGN